MASELPDLFRFFDGRRVQDLAQWRQRRQELLESILQVEYGALPPAPAGVQAEPLHTHTMARLLQAAHWQYRLVIGTDRPFWFLLDLLVPKADGPLSVMLTGDACWRYVTDEIALAVLGRGYILAQFNRVEIVPDVRGGGRQAGLYAVYPDGTFGALAAWAWGYHRCVDFLATLPFVDAAKIAVVGHSRGGKAALLAGATDERIALTAPNDSGCGGAGCFRHAGPRSETLADILRSFPYWFSPGLAEYVGREDQLPFDQHSLKALVAPRALLSTEALGDLWANPTGAWQSHRAACEAYRFLGRPGRIGIWYRPGEHRHSLADWEAALDFADWQFRGKVPSRRFDDNPFPDLPPAHTWSAPQ